MSPDIASTTWHHSRAAERAWTTYFGTKQNWLSSCMTYISKMKKAMTSKLGLSIVKAEDCQKCDIYATVLGDKKLETYFRMFLKKIN